MFSVLQTAIRTFREWQERRIAIATLSAMDDHQLSDIGIERGSVVEAVRGDVPLYSAL